MSDIQCARTIALASGNSNKAREWEVLLGEWNVRTLDMSSAPPEIGETFWENAIAKARYGVGIANADEWVLGEDSGLVVSSLNGLPGVRSARYAGARASDLQNSVRLLEELRGEKNRSGYFQCVAACIPPRTKGARARSVELRVEGVLKGKIADSPYGNYGFGYDPIFVPDGETLTMAALGLEWKGSNSHRAIAARSLLSLIDRW